MSYNLRSFGGIALRRPRHENPTAERYATCPVCGRDDILVQRLGHRSYRLAPHGTTVHTGGRGSDHYGCFGSEMSVHA